MYTHTHTHTHTHTLHTQCTQPLYAKSWRNEILPTHNLQPIKTILSPDELMSLHDLLLQVEQMASCSSKVARRNWPIISSSGRPPLQLLDAPPVRNGWEHQTPPIPKSSSQDTRSSTPLLGLYATLDGVMAPPSPLVEYEQVCILYIGTTMHIILCLLQSPGICSKLYSSNLQ